MKVGVMSAPHTGSGWLCAKFAHGCWIWGVSVLTSGRFRTFVPPVIGGTICSLWAALGWLSVFPNQDILADAVQVQSLLEDPRVVLSFPGQKHGGPLEYPLLLLAELLAPGNYWLHSAPRPVFAFLTGFSTVLLFRRLFPGARAWTLLLAMLVGPSAIHGMLGPESNPVGVWWLQPNWDMAWLLVLVGAILVASSLARSPDSLRSEWQSFAGGVIVGLGIFAHPAIALLVLPLAILVFLRMGCRARLVLLSMLGAAIGLLPAGVSYVINSGSINTWDPSHGPVVNLPLYLEALGLSGSNNYFNTLLPYSLGLVPESLLTPPIVQSVLMWSFFVSVIAGTAIALDRRISRSLPLSVLGQLAVTWLVAMAGIVIFSTVVDPVWIYATSLAPLLWLTLGALPESFTPRRLGTVLALLIIALIATSTALHNASYLGGLPRNTADKQQELRDLAVASERLVKADVDVIFGSYYDAMPLGYASSGDLRVVTNTYNRFPIDESENLPKVLSVAINAEPTGDWGTAALEYTYANCALQSELQTSHMSFALFECPMPSLMDPRYEAEGR